MYVRSHINDIFLVRGEIRVMCKEMQQSYKYPFKGF